MKLTDRQWELVELVGGEGLSYGKAAWRMGISIHTVREYASDIRDRADMGSTAPQRALILIYHRQREAS